jgi:hypothetical protein
VGPLPLEFLCCSQKIKFLVPGSFGCMSVGS